MDWCIYRYLAQIALDEALRAGRCEQGHVSRQ